MAKRTMKNTFPFSSFVGETFGGGMWLQTRKSGTGHGPKGAWAAEDKRVYVDGSRGRFTDPLTHAILDIMERDLGGYPDRHDPLGIMFVSSSDGQSSTRGGGQAHVNNGRSGDEPIISVQLQVPYFNCGMPGVFGRPYKSPLRSVQEFEWSVLSPKGFEELVYRLYEGMDDFKGVEWLQKTNDPDAGRDVSAVRVSNGNRVMIQCKHQKRSIGARPLSDAVNDAMTWKPKFDEVIFVTTTGFSQKGIRWAENHNEAPGGRPTIKLESEGHVRVMVSKQPSLVTNLGIRK